MNDAGAILDYASPRKRGKLRLPAVSRLAVTVDDGRVTIEESLAGEAEAVTALVFAFVVLLVVGSSVVGAVYDFKHHRVRPDPFLAIVLSAAWVAEFATMVAVIHQTWRRTVVTVEYDDLRLAFLSPLRRRWYRWTRNDIADVVIAHTADTGGGIALAEVLITRVAGGDVRLFTDHTATRLEGVARAMRDMLREGRAEPPPTDPETHRLQRLVHPIDALPDPGPRAEQITGRLVDSHRGRRERQGRTADPEVRDSGSGEGAVTGSQATPS